MDYLRLPLVLSLALIAASPVWGYDARWDTENSAVSGSYLVAADGVTVVLTTAISAVSMDFPSLPLGTGGGRRSGIMLRSPDRDQLLRYFTEAEADAVIEYDRAFGAVETERDLMIVYRQALALDVRIFAPKRASDDIWELLDAMIEEDFGIPGLEPSCMAECTMSTFHIEVDDFVQMAVGTTGARDDAFFDLLDAFYDYPVMFDGRACCWPSFIVRETDYSGHSLLGEGEYLRLLTDIDRELDQSSIFVEHLSGMRDVLMEFLLTYPCISSTAKEAMGELKEIRDAGVLRPGEDGAVQARERALEDPEANGIHLQCAFLG